MWWPGRVLLPRFGGNFSRMNAKKKYNRLQKLRKEESGGGGEDGAEQQPGGDGAFLSDHQT